MYKVWVEDSRSERGVVSVEFESLVEAKAALKAFALLAWSVNDSYPAMYQDADPYEFSVETLLCGMEIKTEGIWKDYKADEGQVPKLASKELGLGGMLYLSGELVGFDENSISCNSEKIEIQGGDNNGVHFFIGNQEFFSLEDAMRFCMK